MLCLYIRHIELYVSKQECDAKRDGVCVVAVNDTDELKARVAVATSDVDYVRVASHIRFAHPLEHSLERVHAEPDLALVAKLIEVGQLLFVRLLPTSAYISKSILINRFSFEFSSRLLFQGTEFGRIELSVSLIVVVVVASFVAHRRLLTRSLFILLVFCCCCPTSRAIVSYRSGCGF